MPDNTAEYSFSLFNIYPMRAIIKLGRPDKKPFVGDKLLRIEFPDRVVWQRQIHTGEFHNVIDPEQVAAWEARWQALDKPQWDRRNEALTMVAI